MNIAFDRIPSGGSGGGLFIENFKKYSKHKVTSIKEADVVYLLDFNPSILKRALKYKLQGKKVILYCIGKLSYDQNYITKKMALRICDKIITITNKFGYELFRKRFVIIPNGIDFSIFKNSNMKRQNMELIVGQIHDNKNQMYIAEQAKKYPEINYYMIGEISDNEYFEKISSYNLINLKHINSISQKRLAYYYNKATIVHLASKFEVFPGILLEALACGSEVKTSYNTERFLDHTVNYYKKHIKEFSIGNQYRKHDEVIDSLFLHGLIK